MEGVLTLQDEIVTGFFFAGGIRRGSVVYVTTDRIRVNKRRIQHLAKTGLFVTLLGLVALAVPPIILLAVPVVIASRLSERRASRQKWPSINQVESGHRRFEVKRDQPFSIQLTAPRTLRHGYAKIVPVVGDPIILSIARNKNFMAARTVLYAFDPATVELDD